MTTTVRTKVGTPEPEDGDTHAPEGVVLSEIVPGAEDPTGQLRLFDPDAYHGA